MSKALLVRSVFLTLGVLLLGIRTDAAAQQRDTVLVVTPVPTRAEGSVRLPDVDRGTTPGGAFVRALLIPGWGHASVGAYTRGGFYFAAETTTAFLLARTMRRLALAKDARDLREEGLRESLLASGASPDSVAALVDGDPRVARSRRLVRSRRQQVEDWAALGVFAMFLSGADAFVSAHLRNFPEPVSATLEVAPGSAGVTVGLRLPVGRPHRGR
ncbi:MAG: hypothetical protein EXR95_04690 [Gemmatimonadetes bacterium]|nr:hypothetical protein [Gemmatimonadota bacterium]